MVNLIIILRQPPTIRNPTVRHYLDTPELSC